jgi:hypothetical protein
MEPTSAPALEPRRLRFDDFDEIPKEADRLLVQGYDKAGDWDLSQVCSHLADALTSSVTTGVKPMVSLPVRWYIKWRYLEKVLRSGRLPRGVKAPEGLRSPQTGDATAAVERLREAVAKFKSHQGKVHPHPYFGRLNREQARQFHLIHCAHHFSFLIPVG